MKILLTMIALLGWAGFAQAQTIFEDARRGTRGHKQVELV